MGGVLLHAASTNRSVLRTKVVASHCHLLDVQLAMKLLLGVPLMRMAHVTHDMMNH